MPRYIRELFASSRMREKFSPSRNTGDGLQPQDPSENMVEEEVSSSEGISTLLESSLDISNYFWSLILCPLILRKI